MKKILFILLLIPSISFAQVLLAPGAQRAVDADNRRIAADNSPACQAQQADLPDAQKQLTSDQAALAEAQTIDQQNNPVSQPANKLGT